MLGEHFPLEVLFVPKKDGKWTICIDYQALNALPMKTTYLPESRTARIDWEQHQSSPRLT